MFGFLFKKKKKNNNTGDNDNKNEEGGGGESSSSSISLLQPGSSSRDSVGSGGNISSRISFSESVVSASTNSISVSNKDSGFVTILDQSTLSLVSQHDEKDDKVSQFQSSDEMIEFIDDLPPSHPPPPPPLQEEQKNVPKSRPVEESECYLKRQLKEAERKAIVQLDATRSKLISKETELTLLQADINILAVERDNKAMDVETLTVKLNNLKAENDRILKRIHDLELQLEEWKAKNEQVKDDLEKKSEQLRYHQEQLSLSTSKKDECDQLHSKIKDLHHQIQTLTLEKNLALSKQNDSLLLETNKQLQALQTALEDALESKIKLQTKYEKDLRDMQSANASLLDDFEWKLHQVESNAKRKLMEKDKELQIATSSSISLESEKEKLVQDKETVRLEFRKVEHLKSFETEVIQLRGLTNEQQKSIRAAARQLEQYKMTEKCLQNEISSVKALLEKEKNHCIVISGSTQRRLEVQEKAGLDKLQKQKDDLNATWEDKLKQDCAKLKQELSTMHAQQTKAALESLEKKKEDELTSIKSTWENERNALIREISKLKNEISKNESIHERAMSKVTTTVDRDNLELRRQMDKLYDSQLEEIDTLKAAHTEEMDHLRTRYDNALIQLDNLEKKVTELQTSSTASSDSLLSPLKKITDKDSAIASSKSSMLDGTANEESDCSTDEEESEEEEEDDDDDDCYEEAKDKSTISELREEVATLRDSIDTLTLNLVKNEDDDDKEEEDMKSAVDNGSLIVKGTPNLVKDNSLLMISEECTSSSNTDHSSASYKSTGSSDAVSEDTDDEDESETLLSSIITTLQNPRRLLSLFPQIPEFMMSRRYNTSNNIKK